MLQNYFDHIFLVNLDRRPDRLENVMREFEKIGIAQHVERISAIDKNTLTEIPHGVDPGNRACALSHMGIVKLAKEREYKNYLVFEDDATFCDGFNEKFQERIKQLPDDWNLLYLGANHNMQIQHVSENILKCIQTYTTHAFAAKHTIYDEMIRVWTNQWDCIDVCLWSLQQLYPCYAFSPNLCYQADSFSDIQDKFISDPANMSKN